MPIEDRDDAYLITHTLVKDTLSCLQDVEAARVAFRRDLVKLDHICGYEIIDDAVETEYVTIQTPPAETTGERVKGFDNVVIINVLRTTAPFVEGLFKMFPRAKQGVVSTGRDEEAGMDDDGGLPTTIDCMKLPEITGKDTVIVADPMLTAGSTMCSVLDYILGNAGVDPGKSFVLSAVSAPSGPLHIDNEFPGVDLLTVAIGDYLNDGGCIVPGLDNADDRAFRTT